MNRRGDAERRAADAEQRVAAAEERMAPERVAQDTRILRNLRQTLSRSDIDY